MNERLDAVVSKIDDSFQKAAHHNQSLHTLDYRLMRLEEVPFLFSTRFRFPFQEKRWTTSNTLDVVSFTS